MMETTTNFKNRLTELFKNKKQNVLNIYFTAGYPGLNDTLPILQALEEAGTDMVEIGMPYSDPLADGPTIQESSDVALKNGMTLKMLFSQLKEMRKTVKIPVLLMGYLNPVMQYGIEKFCEDAAAAGIDGLILPDLPAGEYVKCYRQIFEHHNLSNIFLVTPQTSEERIRFIDKNTNGFIYAVSTESTTGNTKDIKEKEPYFQKLKSSGLKNPVMIGFNIHNNETFKFACQYANGAIIGSAFIKMLKASKDVKRDVAGFVKEIKN